MKGGDREVWRGRAPHHTGGQFRHPCLPYSLDCILAVPQDFLTSVYGCVFLVFLFTQLSFTTGL